MPDLVTLIFIVRIIITLVQLIGLGLRVIRWLRSRRATRQAASGSSFGGVTERPSLPAGQAPDADFVSVDSGVAAFVADRAAAAEGGCLGDFPVGAAFGEERDLGVFLTEGVGVPGRSDPAEDCE